MNTPYEAKLHLAVLKATGAKLTIPNAFGDSPNNAHYAAFDMYGHTLAEFEKVCKELGLHTSWYGAAGYPPDEGFTMVVAKYVKGHVITWPGPLDKRYLMSEERLHETQWPEHAQVYDKESDAITVVARLKKRGFVQNFKVEYAS